MVQVLISEYERCLRLCDKNLKLTTTDIVIFEYVFLCPTANNVALLTIFINLCDT
jgi:hypothetical protein